MLAALAGGSLARALALRHEQPLKLRNDAMALLLPALERDPAALWKDSQRYMRFGQTGRETLRRTVEFHMLWLRDLLRAQAGAPAERLVLRDQEDRIRREAREATPREVRRRLMVLEEALQSIEGNVSPDLTIFSTMARVSTRGARLGENQWPAHATASWDH